MTDDQLATAQKIKEEISKKEAHLKNVIDHIEGKGAVTIRVLNSSYSNSCQLADKHLIINKDLLLSQYKASCEREIADLEK